MAQAWLDKRLLVFFNDGIKVIAKRGLCLSYDSVFLELKNERGEVELLPINKIVRVEVSNA